MLGTVAGGDPVESTEDTRKDFVILQSSYSMFYYDRIATISRIVNSGYFKNFLSKNEFAQCLFLFCYYFMNPTYCPSIQLISAKNNDVSIYDRSATI